MKIKCTCGELINDTSDFLPNKGRVMGDKDFYTFWDGVDAAIEKPPPDQTSEATAMQVRRSARTRLVWECMDCGRVYFDDAGNRILEYLPASGRYNAILDR